MAKWAEPVQYKLRLTAPLLDKLREEAVTNGRSLSKEIEVRLECSFERNAAKAVAWDHLRSSVAWTLPD